MNSSLTINRRSNIEAVLAQPHLLFKTWCEANCVQYNTWSDHLEGGVGVSDHLEGGVGVSDHLEGGVSVLWEYCALYSLIWTRKKNLNIYQKVECFQSYYFYQGSKYSFQFQFH